MGHSAVHEYLHTLRRWYKVKRREAPPSQPTCSSGALRSVGCFGCANSRLSSVIAQKQMCAKYRTLPLFIIPSPFVHSIQAARSIGGICAQKRVEFPVPGRRKRGFADTYCRGLRCMRREWRQAPGVMPVSRLKARERAMAEP